MTIKKTYFKTKKTCKVNFRLPKDVVSDVEKVNLVGEFNNWDERATPFRKLKNGSFSTDLELEKGKEYQFRYFIILKSLSLQSYLNILTLNMFLLVAKINLKRLTMI